MTASELYSVNWSCPKCFCLELSVLFDMMVTCNSQILCHCENTIFSISETLIKLNNSQMIFQSWYAVEVYWFWFLNGVLVKGKLETCFTHYYACHCQKYHFVYYYLFLSRSQNIEVKFVHYSAYVNTMSSLLMVILDKVINLQKFYLCNLCNNVIKF